MILLDSSHVLLTRTAGRRGSLYVPDTLAAEMETAVWHGRALHTLIVEAGRRYLHTRKATRR